MLRILIVCCSILLGNAWAKEHAELIFALDLVRHGDRTPLQQLPTVSHHWTQGLGQLTAKGMRQEFELGTKLHKRYIDEQHLLPAQYDAKTLYVRSTNYDRTLMSAQSLLLGLYPLGTGPYLSGEPALPEGFQPIPIHIPRSEKHDPLLIDTDTPKFNELLQTYVYTQAPWKAKEEALRGKYKRWSELTGFEINALYRLQPLADILYIHNLYGLPLPAGLSKEEADEIIETGKWCFTMKFKPKKIGQTVATDLLAMIIDFLEKAEHQNTSLKYVLLMGHDTSILGLLSVMQVPLEQAPGYASWVNFSLFEKENGERFVEIHFNDKRIALPVCDKTACSVAQLAALLETATVND